MKRFLLTLILAAALHPTVSPPKVMSASPVETITLSTVVFVTQP
ncbi:hypothetical protein [Deinococcus aquatilis]|nr:hypothetical protein [Deinococcus aquatilis]